MIRAYYSFFLDPDDSLILYHKGIFDIPTVLDLSRNLHDRLTEKNSLITQKTLAVFIELAQNILKYSSEKSTLNRKNKGIGHIVISEYQRGLLVSSGNVASNADVEKLRERFKEINSLNYDQLRERKGHYLLQGRDNKSSSGNIGLFQIALISQEPLKLFVEPLNENNSYVNISTFLINKKSQS